MKYFEAMGLLSQFHIGGILVSEDGVILDANEAADEMLHGEGALHGKPLEEVAPDFCGEIEAGHYYNIGFMEYLERCPAPEGVELPTNTRMICFENVTSKVAQHMLQTIVDFIPEPIVLADEKKRIIRINNATMRMESLLQSDVEGRDINEVYPEPHSVMTERSENELTVPIVVRDRRPVLGVRQSYQTYQGRKLSIMCDSYPILYGKDLLGVFCVTADMAWLEAMSQQNIAQLAYLTDDDKDANPQKGSARDKLSARYRFSDIVYQCDEMKMMIQKCLICAKSDSPVMLYGETGTGKELVAQSIHNESNRADKPFLAINCAAIPENLLESMLFGTEKGAYTGAERRLGLFEQANGGTLLLDELNSMSMTLQAKLLRVLQDGVVRRLGSTEEKQVDVRVLSNVNVPPYQSIEEGKMREDLFYRLGVVNITIPPLRERKRDIPLLAHTFIVKMNKKLSKSVAGLSDMVLAMFYQYEWPGNVRELEHCIEHAMNIIPPDETIIQRKHLPDRILMQFGVKLANEEDKKSGALEQLLEGIEHEVLTSELRKNNGNISKTARALGISRQNLQHRLKRGNIDPKALTDSRDLDEKSE